MYAVSRLCTRCAIWRMLTFLVVTGMLAAPAGPVTPKLYAESRPVGQLQAMPRQEEAPMAENTSPPETNNGLTIALGEGALQSTTGPALPAAATQPLDASAIQPILDRLPELDVTAALTEEFKLPPASLPPPVPGTTVESAFPPAGTAAAPETSVAGPLEVLRFAPTGEIPVAPFLNVTFNQPMAPLATLDELAAADVPVKLTPALPGVWKWLGTNTLSFEAREDDRNRFPMATEFSVEAPAGTTSAIGGVLEEAVRWTFTTPAPTVVGYLPAGSPQLRNPILFVAFDQAIDPEAVLATITVSAGRQNYPIRLATESEIAADKQVSNDVKYATEGRWLAFRAEQEFPADTTVTVNIGPGTPSAEGPLTTAEAQSFSFQTYAPLRITESYCGYYSGGECPPGMPFTVIFNNPLDLQSIANSLVTADPPIPGMTVSGSYNNLSIQGATAGRTTYNVTVSGAVKDIFGQTLGSDARLTFQTGSASSYLTGPSDVLTTLDPTAATPIFTIYSINYDRLRVRAFAVTPADWPAYLRYQEEFYRDRSKEPPGKQVMDTVVAVDAQPDVLTETSIDLSPALGGKPGHLIVVVDKPASLLSLFTPQNDYVVKSWVQVTNLGLDAIADNRQMVAWATQLTDGAPLAGVQLELQPNGPQATTAGDGTALVELPSQPANLLVGTLGNDTAILPRSTYIWDTSGWSSADDFDALRWYVFDDRSMYRPGEEVHVKGFLRRVGAGPTGDVSLQEVTGVPIDYMVMDPVGNTIANGTAESNNLGGFDLAFTLPTASNLGYASIRFMPRNVGAVGNPEYSHSFQVQEFRRPEFEVTARNATTGPYYLNGEAVVAVSAQYYAGGSLPNADTDWTVTAQPSSYAPPNWPDFVFGVWTPWWFRSGFDDRASEFGYGDPYSPYGASDEPLSYEARTDATGNHYLKMDFVAAEEPRPYSVLAEARVMDLNNQAWAATTTALVHPAELYVGLRSNVTFVEQGDPIPVDLIVTDVDGKAAAGRRIDVRAVRMDWEFQEGSWVEVEADEQTCEIASAAAPVTCTFETTVGGKYQISAEVRDDAERLNRSEFTRWVSGGKTIPSRAVEQETIVLVPDKENYQPGDTAKILVQTPFAPAEGLMTVSRSGILYTERFDAQDGAATLEIPIEEAYLPNLNVQVDAVGAAPRLDDKGNPVEGAPPRPAYGTGSLTLNIPPLSRTLTVTIAPAATQLNPGVETSLDLAVVDAAGQPVADAELAVVVVDEAVLALSRYTLADPLATFYAVRGSNTNSTYGRSSIVLANPQEGLEQAQQARNGLGGGGDMAYAAAAPTLSADMALRESAPMAPPPAPAMMDKAEPAPPATPIDVRTNFNPLATFAPDVRTDAEGKAQVTYKLPDNLTRYRIMVVAATEKQFGSAESNITARLPLLVRPSAPRFLNFGDRIELPVLLQNQTDDAMTVDVVLKTSNLTLEGSQGQRVEVPANDRVEVRFPAATANVGTALVQIAAVSGANADAQTVTLPVYTPATTEAFATYGVVDEGSVAQPLATPQDVFPQFGGLEVTTSSTALQALTDAVIYLQEYPFECSEQIASRVMSVAALRNVLTAFKAAELPPAEQINAAMARNIATLEKLQNSDGGWPVWSKGSESIPYYSIFVAHSLVVARSKDYAVKPETLQAALDHLRNIEAYYPSWYNADVRQTLSTYALYVRQLMDDVDPAKARQVYGQAPVAQASLEALAWLWQVMAGDAASTEQVAEIQRRIGNRVVETAGMANFTTSYSGQEYVLLHSNRRTDAVVLDALIQETPESDLIPKVVRGLMAARTNGRWGNTQENVFVILAMDNYFNTFENVAPDFIARVWLGDTYVAEHTYQGYTTESNLTVVPMRYLVEQPGTQDLIVSKDGDGRLYYRLGLRYADTDFGLDPLDMGFVVQRVYEPVDNPEDVVRGDDGIWRIKAGARVRIRLTMVAVNRRYHVALVDRLPAGLEILNPELSVSESIPSDPSDTSTSYGWWWWGPWYEHQNLRDAGAGAFTTFLWDGVYNYSYVARATVRGDYVAPPAKAEEMYSPEVSGRSGSDRVIVE